MVSIATCYGHDKAGKNNNLALYNNHSVTHSMPKVYHLYQYTKKCIWLNICNLVLSFQEDGKMEATDEIDDTRTENFFSKAISESRRY